MVWYDLDKSMLVMTDLNYKLPHEKTERISFFQRFCCKQKLMLPFEIWLVIVEFLSVYDLFELGLTCKALHRSLFQNEMIWRIMLRRDWFDTKSYMDKPECIGYQPTHPKCSYIGAITDWHDVCGKYDSTFHLHYLVSGWRILKFCEGFCDQWHHYEYAPRFIKRARIYNSQKWKRRINTPCNLDKSITRCQIRDYEMKKLYQEKVSLRKKLHERQLALTEKRIRGQKQKLQSFKNYAPRKIRSIPKRQKHRQKKATYRNYRH